MRLKRHLLPGGLWLLVICSNGCGKPAEFPGNRPNGLGKTVSIKSGDPSKFHKLPPKIAIVAPTHDATFHVGDPFMVNFIVSIPVGGVMPQELLVRILDAKEREFANRRPLQNESEVGQKYDENETYPFAIKMNAPTLKGTYFVEAIAIDTITRRESASSKGKSSTRLTKSPKIKVRVQ